MSTSTERPYTAWHAFFAQILTHLADRQRLQVHAFEKLGALPLEADVVCLRPDPSDPAPPFAGRLPWLAARLRRLSVLEFKSPGHALRRPHFDRSIAYAMLAKDQHQLLQDHEVAVLLLASQLHGDLLPSLARDGVAFSDDAPGILRGVYGGLACSIINLSDIAARDPHDPMTIVSSRHRDFRPEPSSPDDVAVFALINYLIHQKEANGMKLEKLEGFDEIAHDLVALQKKAFSNLSPDLWEELIATLSPSQRLVGLSPSERLAGLSPSDVPDFRKKVAADLSPSERLAGLSASQLAELRNLLNR